MQTADDKLYGLIIQAQEMQKYALEFRGTAENAVSRLPEAARNAVRETTKEILIEGTEKASRGLLEASRVAIAAAEELRSARTGALLKHITILFFVTVIFSAAIYFGLGFLAKQRAAELNKLTIEAEDMQATVEKLSSQYGKAQFNTCDGRPCIRVEEKKEGRYTTDTGAIFRIIYGY